MKRFFSLFIALLPWQIHRWILIKFWKYEIHPSASIGFSYIAPKKLIMRKNSKIGHLNVAVNLDNMILEENSIISRSNWITGFPTNTNSSHYSHQINRESKLVLGKDSSITKKHHLDCTNSIFIGQFVTIAGYSTQLLTHSIDIQESRQDSKPIIIGNYCFVGTNCVLLGGSELPSYSVLGAKSLLNKKFEEGYKLYGGVPAKPILDIDKSAKYFKRISGFVN